MSIRIRFFYLIRSHPILLIVLILLQTSCLCLIGWIKLKIRWFSYVLFLIFLGGLIVLFIYITRLASNEIIVINLYSYGLIIILTTFLRIFLINFNNFQQIFDVSTEHFSITFNFIYSLNRAPLVLVTIVYLLLTLIIVVKISNKFDAPIKNIIFRV